MQRFSDRSDAGCLIIIIGSVVAAVVLVVGLMWVLPSYFEARAYNNATGAHVSTWDAMWVELRVQQGARDADR